MLEGESSVMTPCPLSSPGLRCSGVAHYPVALPPGSPSTLGAGQAAPSDGTFGAHIPLWTALPGDVGAPPKSQHSITPCMKYGHFGVLQGLKTSG